MRAADGVTVGHGFGVGERFLPTGERVAGARQFRQHDQGAPVIDSATREVETMLDVALSVFRPHLHVEMHGGDPDGAHCRSTVPLRGLVHLTLRAIGHWFPAFG